MSTFVPHSLPHLWTCDAEVINKRVSEDASRLFAKAGDRLEVWTLSTDNGLVKQLFTDNDLIRQHLEAPYMTLDTAAETTTVRGIIFTGVNLEKDYVNVGNLATEFLTCVLALIGNKVEICYTVRFFEENQRNTSNPWSLRQTAVYQGVDYSTDTSTFILLQPSSYIERRLGDKLHAITHDESSHELRHILLHLVLLSSSLVNWRHYIATQISDLEQLEEKTTFSKADYLVKNDFSLRFSDRQNLQNLQRTLTKAARLLDCSINLGEKMKQLFQDEDLRDFHKCNRVLLQNLEDYIYEASYHRRVVSDLLQRSTDTCNLLTSILQYRVGNSELESTKTLVTIASQGETDGKVAHKTATSAAALTFAATVYLPASLLAT
ncbi:hypothetical protein CIB48_g6688 [Xylaria polymorpha]|nr:hypothetical protein CIB48_g6688 [Xylaria polymorpha]